MDARKLSPEGQADLRRRAVAAVQSGMSQLEAARVFGVSRRAVGVWVRAHRVSGPDALNSHRRGRAPGEQFALSRRQQVELLQAVAGGLPEDFGIAAALWSRRALAELIEVRFGVELSGTTVGLYVARWGLTGEAARRQPGSVETLWVRWHRPVPEFVGTPLMPGPGSIARGPVPGEVGPPRTFLDVLVAESARGTTHFRALSRPYTVAALQDFEARVAQVLDHPVKLTVSQWPAEQSALLRAWRTSAAPWAG